VDLRAYRYAPFAWLTASICFLFFGFYAIFFNLEEWAAATGLGYKDEIPGEPDIFLPNEVPKDAIRTFYLLSIMNATSTIGRVCSAYLCDHFGALNVHAIVTFTASLLVLLLWTMAKTVPLAIVYVVLFGVFSGAVIGLPPASVAYVLGPDPIAQSRLGQWTGQMYSTAAPFALTGPVIAGHLISEYGDNYLTVQLWSGGCLFSSACCMTAAVFFRWRMGAEERARQINRGVSVGALSAAPMVTSQSEPEKENV
jgi:MFS transporter, MCT family, solute carrier family 16 (monocarboxylic acid transporters), member 10